MQDKLSFYIYFILMQYWIKILFILKYLKLQTLTFVRNHFFCLRMDVSLASATTNKIYFVNLKSSLALLYIKWHKFKKVL